tara:strand:- start:8974 stop:9474 length:501 start_codon:yes stop_codon:yes gene_type:complete
MEYAKNNPSETLKKHFGSQKFEQGGEVDKTQGPGDKLKIVDADGKYSYIPFAKDPSNPESALDGKFYISGKEVTSQEMAAELKGTGIDLNDIAANGLKSAVMTFDKAAGEWGYGGNSKDFRQSLEDRTAFEAEGEEGFNALQRKRTDSHNDYWMAHGATEREPYTH